MLSTASADSCSIQAFAGIERTAQNIIYGGDGGQASSASFSKLYGVWANTNSQELLIADRDNNRVREVNLNTNIISLVAGGVTSGTLGVNFPTGSKATGANIYLKPYHVCGDSVGQVYIVEQAALKVRKVDFSGIISTFAGSGANTSPVNGAATSTGLPDPQHCGVDSNADVYLAEAGSFRVYKIQQSNGILARFAGNGNASPATQSGVPTSSAIGLPHNLFIDSVGNFFMTDATNQRVRKTVLGSNLLITYAGLMNFTIYGQVNLNLRVFVTYRILQNNFQWRWWTSNSSRICGRLTKHRL